MAKKQIDRDLQLFAAALAAHDRREDLEGMKLVIRAVWRCWPEIAYAASEQDIFEDRLGNAAHHALFHSLA